MNIGNMIVPGVIGGILLYGLLKEVDIFEVFLEGAKEGIQSAIQILPTLVALMTCVGMFKVSGALDILTHALSPFGRGLMIPEEVLPLAILRPISGSGAMVLFQDILERFGPDSTIGRIASVLEGSSETTFYTIAVYFGAIGITHTRHALPASLTADIVGVVMSAVMVRLVFSL